MRKFIPYPVLFCFMILAPSAWGQISTYRGIATLERQSYNYAPEKQPSSTLKKNKELRVVYSDRAKNKAFTNAYAQRITQEQELGNAYYIVGEKNGYYELVQADSKSVGRPKGLFGFLYSARRHFKDSKSLTYIGWMPKSKLLLHNHAFVSVENHRPLRYCVGISDIKRLYGLHHFLKGDSLSVFADPGLKQELPQKIVMGEFVYIYKVDDTKRSVLVSDKATLDTSGRKILGWIPADLTAYVGQTHVFSISNLDASKFWTEELVEHHREQSDSLTFCAGDLQGNLLFTQGRRQVQKTLNSDSTEQVQWAVNLPLSIWDHSKNKLINVKGGEIAVSAIRRIARGQKKLNVHLLFYQQEQAEVKRLINAFQNIALKTQPSKVYTFSASVISGSGNKYFLPTDNFASWLDFLLGDNSSKRNEQKGLQLALQHLVGILKPDSFEDNLIFILGSNQEIRLHLELLTNLARCNASIALIQVQNKIGEDYQDFLLQGKELLEQYITQNNNYLARYIVNPALLKPSIFFDYGTDASVYLLDVPRTSLAVGGIVFPSSGEHLSNIAVETVIDTLFSHLDKRNELLLASLVEYEKKLGVLRSQPSQAIVQLHQLSSQREQSLDNIHRNSVGDTYHSPVWLPEHLLQDTKEGHLFSREELVDLLHNYRALLPSFTDSIGKADFKVLRKLYKRERKMVNAVNYRKQLTRKDNLATLFYHKVGVWPNEALLYALRPCDLRYKQVAQLDWEKNYRAMLTKVKDLEEGFINGKLEQKSVAGDTYYFIPQNQLP